MPLFLNTFGLHTLHGRALPVATGLRLARPDLPVVVVAGDGDFFSIGTNHFVHAARKNFDMTVLCIDNRRYAMTKNQSSPTSPQGHCGSLSPSGESCRPLNVMEFAIACNASFVARSFAGDPGHLRSTIAHAMEHRGFAFVEIIAPCNIYDTHGTNDLLSSSMISLPDNGRDVSDRAAALAHAARALDYDISGTSGIEIGVFYRADLPVYEDHGAVRSLPLRQEKLPETVIKRFTL
jgi:2-oxoglutarate ferredoxin oxidoreductase subunit beta